MDTAQLQQIADSLVKTYGHEIARDGDWWHGIDGHDFNIHSPNEDEHFSVNVYNVTPTGTDYSQWLTLKPVVIEGTA